MVTDSRKSHSHQTIFERKKLNEISIFSFLVASPFFGFEPICFRNLFSSFRTHFTTHLKFSLTGLQKILKKLSLMVKMLVIQLSYMEIVWQAFFVKKNSKSVFSVTSLLNCFQKAPEIV